MPKRNKWGYPEKVEKLEKLTFFDLSQDPSERFNIADKHTDVIEEIKSLVHEHESKLVKGETQL